jgi:hypothetical protein
MAITMNTNLKNDLLDGIDTVFNSGTLEIRTGSPPGAGTAATGTVLVTIALPADAFAAASSGTKAKAGTWQDLSADASGTAGHFRLVNAAGTRVLEGTVTQTGAGGDMTLDNTNIAVGQQVTVSSFTLSSGN